MKVEFVGINSQVGSYAVYDEQDRLVGYSDVVGRIDYDAKGSYTRKYDDTELEITSITELL